MCRLVPVALWGPRRPRVDTNSIDFGLYRSDRSKETAIHTSHSAAANSRRASRPTLHRSALTHATAGKGVGARVTISILQELVRCVFSRLCTEASCSHNSILSYRTYHCIMQHTHYTASSVRNRCEPGLVYCAAR